MQLSSAHYQNRKTDNLILSPVLEKTTGDMNSNSPPSRMVTDILTETGSRGAGPRVVEISSPPQYSAQRSWNAAGSFRGGGPNTRSMENVISRGMGGGTPPSMRRGRGGGGGGSNSGYEHHHIPNGHLPPYRDVRIPPPSTASGMGGSNSSLSHSHEYLPQVGGRGGGGDLDEDEIRSDIHQQYYRKASTASNVSSSGGVLMGMAPTNPHAHAHSLSQSYSGGSPRVTTHYRSVSIGNGTSVPVPSYSSSFHSHSISVS